ncbi:MAG: response regulator [Alphaproteobacteria bacterium]|nr:response regulator [Alphaproteobacteria bacterium]
MAKVIKNEDDQNYKVLLVEDEAADVILGKNRILDIWPDATIISVQSIGEAYSAYSKHNFNLILLDLNLPDAYGAAAVQEVRSFNKGTPIVVLTGMGTDMTVNQAIKLGANHVVLKSQIMNDDFKNILEQHVVETF